MEKNLLRSKIVCPDYNKSYPSITHGLGCYLYDTDGTEYLDASAGSCAVSLIGHGDENIVTALAEQSKKVAVLPAHYLSAEVIQGYLKSLCEFSGFGHRAWTCSSGTEAVENAMKVALQYHQINGQPERFKILGRHGSYHGNSIFNLGVGGMPMRRASYKHLISDFAKVDASYSYRFADGDPDYGIQSAESLRACIEQEGPETVAAFIAEPVVGAALGAVPAADGYFERIREICDEYGILLIVDEVMSGMGRTGRNFAIEHYNCEPDILATGKGIGGGYFPLSAFIVNKRVADAFVGNNQAFLGGHTHACTPQAAAVGQYVLDYIKEHNIVAKAEADGLYMKQQLQDLLQYDIVGDVRGVGYMIGIEFVSDKTTREPFAPELNVSANIGQRLLEQGVILYPGKGSVDGYAGDHILITPPLTLTREQIDHMCHCLAVAIEQEMDELRRAHP
ncbi:aspartate aminotransferase family protein [Pseudoalteromonas luteoviolacea]|uniref:Aminotransferase class III n=1 Tax=Pseudoalteromonas luteoviolacea S4054 TaxID=1129367 RepID=A0A0F6AC28_9GAMM|nr:aminotransferase class III-fold pyridoxal phosphate-dependent enzyme [Pseudoalteromonas luteoviolacea]KKE83740.1 hypothetical protein N479_13005 [Pseudoalteromonas luteoviolacea S4054]KZN71944.1 hypothetical protein N481_17370 [Pseudoalteromonas luteoviolacea S4047-1]